MYDHRLVISGHVGLVNEKGKYVFQVCGRGPRDLHAFLRFSFVDQWKSRGRGFTDDSQCNDTFVITLLSFSRIRVSTLW